MFSALLPNLLAQGKGGKGAPKGPLFQFKAPEANASAVAIDQLDLNELLINVGIAAAAIFGTYILVFVGLRLWFRTFRSDAALVTLRVSQVPAFVVALFVFLNIVLKNFESIGAIVWIDHLLIAGCILSIAFLVNRILSQVVFYYLKAFAENSEAQWDDVLIPILETALPIVIYVLATFFALQEVGLDLSGLWLAFGGLTFVIGFALQDILKNFFSGLVLLIDTPFRFGDVISWGKNSRAVIKKVGLRLTQLYLIDQHCEVYVPNSKFEAQKIINLSRPTSNYFYTVSLAFAADAEPNQAMQLIQAVVLAHPDTLGDIQQKIELIDRYFGASLSKDRLNQKREAGRLRLIAERDVNLRLGQVESAFDELSRNITRMEDSGLDQTEIRTIQGDYLDICQMIGLDVVADRNSGRRKRTVLEESSKVMEGQSLIRLLRDWYGVWLKDPDLLQEDQRVLPQQWELRIELFKSKLNKLFRKLSEPSADDTRLDDSVQELFVWMQDGFKTSRNQWQDPRIWMSAITLDRTQMMGKDFTVKFYVDDITLEHFQRGNRVESEVNRELAWHLRKAYLVR
ncbi:MAG: mechanosensitive ion channel family protein [Prochlorotrichaceae cyanobacterium]|jgi:MscS family membrane protein